MTKTDRALRSDTIASVLRKAIIEQALPTGARLPEDAIGDRFGVSRTLVREALAILSNEGLVEHRRNRGAIVAEPSWEDARDLFDLRITLEKGVVTRLAGTLSDEQIAQLRSHIAAEEKARDAKENALSIRLGGEFHVALAKMTNSAILLRYTRELTSRCSLMLALYSRPVSAECGVAEHRCIVDHIAAGKLEQAVVVMERHLTAVVDRALIKPRQPPQRPIVDVLSQYIDSAEPQNSRAGNTLG